MISPQESPSDLRDLLQVVWRRRWAVLFTLVAIPTAAYALSSQVGKTYESTATLRVQPVGVDTSLIEGGSAPTPDEGELASAARVVTTSRVAVQAAKELKNPPEDPRALLSQITARPNPETADFITLRASASSPRRAADIANAFAAAAVTTRASDARKRVDSATQTLDEQLKRVRDRTERRQLSAQLQRLRALRATQGSNAQIIESAGIPGSPASPRPTRNAVLGFILAILVAGALPFLLERLDRRIRTHEELERLSGLSLLASVPSSAFPGEEPSPHDNEAFQTLQASLTYFNVDHQLRSVVITSPGVGEGKTTVSTNLALALARAGKDVILVDADLRHPQVDARLGVRAETGLGAVLAGETPPQEALFDIHVTDGRLRILPAGPPPPNPGRLLNSERMRSLVDELSRQADLVILDTTPVLPISDVIPLIGQASGVVAVARLNHTTRDAMRRFQGVIASAEGILLGVVATDDTASGFYSYGYGYGYGYGDYEPSAPLSEGGARVDGRAPASVSERPTRRPGRARER